MYIIAEIQGKQYRFANNAVIEVDRLDKKEKTKFKLDKILLCSNGTESLIGQPHLKNVKVEVEVVGETKGKKVVAFKFKRRKGYHKKIGHRHKYTMLKILSIEAPIAAKKKEKKVEKPKAHKQRVVKPKVAAKPKTAKPKVKKKATKK